MDSISTGKYDSRSVDWSHPMNNSTQLPPKSPHGYSMFGSSSLFESSGGLNLLPNVPGRAAEHRRSPSTGYLPRVQPTWFTDTADSPEGVVVLKKCSHRRSSSDSVAFVDNSYEYTNYLENVTEEDESVLQEPQIPLYRPTHRRGLSVDFKSPQYAVPVGHSRPHDKRTGMERDLNRLDRDQFARVADSDLSLKQQLRLENIALCNRMASEESRNLGKGKKHGTLSGSSSKIDIPFTDRGRTHNLSNVSFENRSTASDSNSHSDDSNDELRPRSNERFRSESEALSEEGGDGPLHDGATGSEQVEPVLDPKKAKRVLANRQSAQRSRVRKLQYISELERSVNALETEVATLSPQVGYYDHQRVLLTAENVLLKQKLAAVAKSQRMKEAHNETLKTEVQRLLQMYNQQKQPQHHIQHLQQPPLSLEAVDLQQLRFSKLDLGPQIPKPKSPNAHASGTRSFSGRPALYPTKAVSPTHNRNSSNVSRPASHTGKGMMSPSCMVPSGKSLAGGMLGGAGTSFMVHNS